jgi:hypothetical protein
VPASHIELLPFAKDFVIWIMAFRYCSPVVGMSVNQQTTYRNCQRTNIAPRAWVELNQIQKALCYGKMGLKSQLVKGFHSIIRMFHCCIMSILSYIFENVLEDSVME